MDRTILHIDMNNFYASVEIHDNPSLAGLPVAVGGSEEARRGMIVAQNCAAKAVGATPAEPVWEARR